MLNNTSDTSTQHTQQIAKPEEQRQPNPSVATLCERILADIDDDKLFHDEQKHTG
tara:strand:- start:584 stop:748 length:165 start_codon:yes stop_codon:yes gene_type:complete